jgi:hypothetical protein
MKINEKNKIIKVNIRIIERFQQNLKPTLSLIFVKERKNKLNYTEFNLILFFHLSKISIVVLYQRTLVYD